MLEGLSAHRGRPALARRLGGALLAAAAVASTPAAGYYEESHVTGDEARVTLDGSGMARVEHEIAWHVVAGQYHFFELSGVDGAAGPETDAAVTAEDGRVISAGVVPREGGALRVVFEDPKGVKHGRYKIRLAYGVDLVQAHAFTRDGAMWRLTWQGPTFSDGYDGARATFAIPASVDEPRPADPSSGPGAASGPAPGILATLRRTADHDELELVKPHVARHEAVAYSLRVAPRAFPGVRDPSLRPPPLPARPPAPERGLPPLLLLGAALAAALAYTYVAYAKAIRFEGQCRAFGAHARGLVPLPIDLRAASAGAALGAGVLLQSAGLPTCGAACVASAMLLAAHRPPDVKAAPRGPGKWLALRPAEAFGARRAFDPFDPATLRGAAAAIGALVVLVGVGLLLRRVSSQAPYLVGLDAVALLPLVVTGRRSQLPPDARTGSRWLGGVFRRLAKRAALRVVPWARVPTGCAEPDEVRVLVVPRAAMPGVVGIEVGLSFRRFATAFAAAPAVLVRVQGSSAASARMTTLAPFVRPVPGRTSEERVFQLGPRLPTRDGTLGLVRRLARELEDRRLSASPWDMPERRLSPAERESALPRAA